MIRPLLRDLANGDEVLQECKVKSLWATEFLSIGQTEQKVGPELFESQLSVGIGSRVYTSLGVRYSNMVYLGIPGRFLGSSINFGGIYLTTDYGTTFTAILVQAGTTYCFAKSDNFIIAVKRLTGGSYNEFLLSSDNGLTFSPNTSGLIGFPSNPSPNDLIEFNGFFYYIQTLSVSKIQTVPVNVTSIITNPVQMRQLFATDNILYASSLLNGGLYYSDGSSGFVLCTFDIAGNASSHWYVLKHNGITYSFGSNGIYKSLDGINFAVIPLPVASYGTIAGNLLVTTASIFASGKYNNRYDRFDLIKYVSGSGGRMDFYTFDFDSSGNLSPIFKTSRLTCQEDLRSGQLNGIHFADDANDGDRTLIWGIRNDGVDYTVRENPIADYPVINRQTNSETINVLNSRQIALACANSNTNNEISGGSTNGVISISQDGNLRYYYNVVNTDICGPSQLVRLRFDGSLARSNAVFSNGEFQILWDVVTRQFRIQFFASLWFSASTYNHFYRVEWSAGVNTFSSNLNPFIINTPLYLANANAVSNIAYNNTQASPMSIMSYFSPSSNAASNPTFLLTAFISSLGLVSFQIEKR